MTQLLPITLAALAGLGLVLALTAFWQSVRGVLLGSAMVAEHVESAAERERAQLLQEKQALLQAIRDVRFEHELGKLSDADRERLEAGYRARAREVLQALDAQLAPYRDRAKILLGDGAGEGAAPTASAPAGTEVSAVAARACTACSTSNDDDALFCKKCGHKLEQVKA